jgi:hypothetical protein
MSYLRNVKGLNFFQGLKNGFVRRKHQRILAISHILAPFVREQELIEDASRHEDRLAGTHGQSKNIIWVIPRTCL